MTRHDPYGTRRAATIVSVVPSPILEDSRAFKEAAAFREFGFRSVVADVRVSRGAGSDGTAARDLKEDGIAWRLGRWIANSIPLSVRRALAPAEWILAVARLNAAVWPQLGDGDIFYLHGYQQFPAVWLRVRRRRKPFIYDAHDLYSALREDLSRISLSEKIISRIERIIEAACVRRATAIVTVGPGLADAFTERFARRPIVVRNAHNPPSPNSESTIRRDCGTGPSDFLVVNTGNCKRGMAVEQILAALDSLPANFHVAFVGRGYEAWRAEAADRACAARAHFVGPVPSDHVVDYIAGADAAIVAYEQSTTNLRHALPNGFLAPVAAALPTAYSALPEVARISDEFGIGCPIGMLTPEGIAAALRELHDRKHDPALMAAQARASGVYNWTAEMSALEAAVTNALNRRA